jgi:4-carboxymuconolactone decarboxylase
LATDSFAQREKAIEHMGEVNTGPIEVDVESRQAHVIGEGPRIAPLPNEGIGQATWDLVNAIRASAGAPPAVIMPDYMRMALKHPEIFRCQMDMGNVLYNGEIPARERELAVLRCGWLCRAPYEWGQHVTIGKRIGLSQEEIERTMAGSSAPGWSEHDEAIVRGVEELLGDHALSDATWETLAKSWTEQQLIEFPMMVGQYVATAFVQNSLRVPMEPGNPGLSQR